MNTLSAAMKKALELLEMNGEVVWDRSGEPTSTTRCGAWGKHGSFYRIHPNTMIALEGQCRVYRSVDGHDIVVWKLVKKEAGA